MGNTAKILRNCAYSLIIYALISALTHLFYSVVDYNNGILNVNVIGQVSGKTAKISGLDFTNSEIGVLKLKPALSEAIVLENYVFQDGGAGIVFYLVLGTAILLAVKFKLINVYKIEEQNIYQLLVLIMFLFFGVSMAGKVLMDNYVLELTNGMFKHYDNTHGFSSLFGMGMIILANATYQFIVYTRKLKLENDLTI